MTLWHVAIPGFLIISSVSGIVNVMCLVMPAAALLLILDTLGAIIISQWAQWIPVYKIWNHSISKHTGRYQHQSFCNWGLLSSPAEISGFLEYQLHVKEIVLYFSSSLRCIKIWIAICYRELICPESDGFPCAGWWCCIYQFKWPLCKKKCSVGFSMMLQSQRW